MLCRQQNIRRTRSSPPITLQPQARKSVYSFLISGVSEMTCLSDSRVGKPNARQACVDGRGRMCAMIFVSAQVLRALGRGNEPSANPRSADRSLIAQPRARKRIDRLLDIRANTPF